jgi:isopropylmalate/homocitrate/citramalate synthase
MRRGVIGAVGKVNRGLMQLSQRSHHCGHPHTHQHTPKSVRIVEVGPRDGLQNEKQPITFQQKLQLIGLLKQTGLKNIEAGSFVSPKWVPQMADAENIFSELAKETDGKVMYSALTPNTKGTI